MPDIILASTSARRRELLTQVHVPFTVVKVDIDESPKQNESGTELAVDYVKRMAYEKCQQAINTIGHDKIIITADTIGKITHQPLNKTCTNANPNLVLDPTPNTTKTQETILIKPTCYEDAQRMWMLMSGRSHQVYTAVCVAYNHKILQTLVCTEVHFVTLTQQMMKDYWQSGEPADKAGAYAIQGLGAKWVKSINGSYANVVGLPIVETLDLITQIQNNTV